MATVTQHKNNTQLCPVLAYLKIVQHILSYPKGHKNSPINLVMINSKTHQMTGKEVFTRIRTIVSIFGKSDLGFSANEVGTHSIRSSAAMQLFLNKIPTYQIMLLGRWSSDAFLKYIRRQVQEFSSGLSRSMVNKEFFTIPEVETVDNNDPRTRNTASFSTTAASDSNPRGARFPSPAVHTWL